MGIWLVSIPKSPKQAFITYTPEVEKKLVFQLVNGVGRSGPDKGVRDKSNYPF